MKANRFCIDTLYLLIDIRRFVFLAVLLGLFSSCETMRNLDEADNNIGSRTSLAMPSKSMQSPAVSYSLELLADGFQKPIYITHAGDSTGRLFVVEQSGIIRIVTGGHVLDKPFLDLSDKITRRSSEQG